MWLHGASYIRSSYKGKQLHNPTVSAVYKVHFIYIAEDSDHLSILQS